VKEIFDNIITSIKNLYKESKEWEESEIFTINIIQERLSSENGFNLYKSFSDIKPSFYGIKLLGAYLNERFNIQTILISPKSKFIDKIF
jgi:hypothetical protein